MTRLIPTHFFGLAQLGYRIFSIAFASYLLASAIPISAAEQKSAATAAPSVSSPEPSAIALADIAARATDVSNTISNLTAAAAPSAQIENISNSLPELSKKLDEYLAETRATLAAQPSLEVLQTLQQDWQRDQVDATAWLNTLTQQATKLQNGLNQLDDLAKTWSTTRASIEATSAPGPILQQIDVTLTAITAARGKLQSDRTALLDLQSRVAQEITKCTTALTQIGQFQQKAVAGIFAPDAPPIWRVDLWGDAVNVLPELGKKVFHARWADFKKYVREPREGSGLHAALFIFLALLFSVARRKVNQWTKSGVPTAAALLVFHRPFSAALATTLLLITSPFVQISLPVRQILWIVVLVPMLRLVRPVVSSSIASLCYAICLLFAVDILRQAYAGIQLVAQTILMVETLAAIVMLLRTRRHYRQIIAEQAESSRLIILGSVRFIILTTLIIALLAGGAGYLRLARLLTPGIFVGGVLALSAFVYLQVAGGVVAVAFRLWPLRLLHMVAHHRDLLARKIYRLLVWAAILGWLTRYLNYLGLLDSAWSLAQSVLATRIERGTISFSVGNILEFLLTVTLAYLLSRFLRFALQEDFYPRINLAPGLSYAVSSLLNYIILALGFVAGLGVLGVNFSNLSIMAGAFGVGIGFGLQSIVNNFVSGLILLFER
ncbi:MAG TPA: hypothetical protein VEI95_08825, partial [Acidobacteriota bacterium]|nr:hypothetical protein [Acidobacteriota bacterium]